MRTRRKERKLFITIIFCLKGSEKVWKKMSDITVDNEVQPKHSQ